MTLFVGYLAGSIATVLLLVHASMADQSGRKLRAKSKSVEH